MVHVEEDMSVCRMKFEERRNNAKEADRWF